jgi:hypothetical protein
MTAVDGYVFDFAAEYFDGTRTRPVTAIRRTGFVFDVGGEHFYSSRHRIITTLRRAGFSAPVGGGGAPAPVTNYYHLAAVDSGVGRRLWISTSADFSGSPTPVGTWVTATLTILASWQ